MSLRRKSCVACFEGRRKCNLQFPACGRCQRTKKSCHYTRFPPLTPDLVDKILDETSVTTEVNTDDPSTFKAAPAAFSAPTKIPLPWSLGNLGNLTPVLGRTSGEQWVLERLRKCPQSFVTNAATFFIHKDMQAGTLSPTLRSAFGASASSLHLNEHNQTLLFQSIDDDMAQLLTTRTQDKLTEDLARLQAMVLYQHIRLFSGDLRQRIIFESQETLMGRLCWQLLQCYSEETRELPLSRASWILGESIRRTVLVSYTLYGMYSYFKHGTCLDLATVSTIPVSKDQTLWENDNWVPQSRKEETNWVDWMYLWHEEPRSPCNEFEKLLLVSCAGLEAVEAIESIDADLAYLSLPET